jgi:hypothetical protein
MLWPNACAAPAADHSNSLAMPFRRDGETLPALIKRLDKAIARDYGDDVFTDEVNSAKIELCYTRHYGFAKRIQ